ncbi:beta,beta-carotene 15,15'-dioxygenase-like [Nilaparvata lugens]|uniref:beta,beta-carotene 15,15'-dioxygenase-like n=1 Tax=Nilaparvata lugens TaxID=108931 RepID=UPI00193E3C9F|nr:beta,beta-carotene 15,15'-dioxygenase-like [Nilaparvata lugens]
MADFSGLFRSTEEQATPIQANVKGLIPQWLNGDFVRLGPGKFDLSKTKVKHWFDGLAVVYKFEIVNGTVFFRKRFLNSDAYKKATEHGQSVYTEFGTKALPEPGKNILAKFIESLKPELTDNSHVNLFKMEDSLFVASETHFLRRVNVGNLETLDKIDLLESTGVHLSSSHFVTDRKGDSYTIGTSLPIGKYNVIKVPKCETGKADHGQEAIKHISVISTMSPGWGENICFYHSFGVSENYIVLIETPFIYNMLKLLSVHVKRRCLRECLNWYPDRTNRFFVIHKESGNVLPVNFRSREPFFLLHHINCYEEDDQLVVDIIKHKEVEVLDNLYLDNLRKSEFDIKNPAVGCRFVLPLPQKNQSFPINTNLITISKKATAIKEKDTIWLSPELLSEPGYELPAINRQYFGVKYRFYYSTGMFDPGQFRNSLVKVDTMTGCVDTWRESESTFPGEPQFVHSPNPAAEDDGILLSCVTDLRANMHDFLLILDARTMTEIARAEVDCHVPNVIHGLFIPKI